MKLEGKNIILTGASRGFGKYLAGRLWNEGASLMLVSRTPPSANDIINPVRAERMSDRRLEYQYCDLGSRVDIDTMLNKIDPYWIPFDGLINNAAMQGPVGKAWDFSVDDRWDEIFRVNLAAPIRLCQFLIHPMLKRQHGKIINLSGGGAAGPRPNYSAYATAKAGLVRFSECLAEELKGTGIDVNCVAPGLMLTDMTRETVDLTQEESDATMAKAADLIIYLLSDASNGITGKLISAKWDDWQSDDFKTLLLGGRSELCTLRRVEPKL